MKIKRVIAACLAAVMVVLPLSGCGNAGGGQQGNGSGHVEVLRIGTTYKNDGYSAMNSESAYGRLNYHSFSQLNLMDCREMSGYRHPGPALAVRCCLRSYR